MSMLTIQPGRIPESKGIGEDPFELSPAVEGLKQAVYLSEKPIVLICHKERRLLDLSLSCLRLETHSEILEHCRNVLSLRSPAGQWPHSRTWSRSQFIKASEEKSGFLFA